MRISDWSSDVCSSDLNLDIEQARINERISDVDYRQSKYDLLPDLNGSASHSISFGRSVNPITDVIDDQRISAGGFNLNAKLLRSEERRVGKEGVSTGKSRWSL